MSQIVKSAGRVRPVFVWIIVTARVCIADVSVKIAMLAWATLAILLKAYKEQ